MAEQHFHPDFVAPETDDILQADDGTLFRANLTMLAGMSPHFAKIRENALASGQAGIPQLIKIPNVSSAALAFCLRLIHNMLRPGDFPAPPVPQPQVIGDMVVLANSCDIQMLGHRFAELYWHLPALDPCSLYAIVASASSRVSDRIEQAMWAAINHEFDSENALALIKEYNPQALANLTSLQDRWRRARDSFSEAYKVQYSPGFFETYYTDEGPHPPQNECGYNLAGTSVLLQLSEHCRGGILDYLERYDWLYSDIDQICNTNEIQRLVYCVFAQCETCQEIMGGITADLVSTHVRAPFRGRQRSPA